MNKNEVIRIIRELAVIAILILIGFRIVNSEFSINLGTLSVTDIVALLLAFFAVGLSAAFYFKSSDSSNRFYDNMHKFTQDTSVILGKIESKFSEQLKNIEQKSQDLKNSVDRYYASNGSSNSEDIAKEKEEVEKQATKSKEQYEEILENLFKKAKLDETEKGKLKEVLHRKEEELKSLQSELNNLSNEEKNVLERRISRHLTRIIRKHVATEKYNDLEPMELFLEILKTSNPVFLNDLYEYGYITTPEPSSVEDIKLSAKRLFMSLLQKSL
ncbi:hypothetical protein [Microbacterium sp. NPDC077057]|uniref:hypothetical protein n=1 Tax=Microbacterium sp. NPDC077057 TaxID=3154763 RepID=UPI00341D4486